MHSGRQHLWLRISKNFGYNAGPPLGAFSHSAGTAPITTVFIPGTPLQTTPPPEACMIHSRQPRGGRIQDPGTRGYRRWNTAAVSHSARCAPFAVVAVCSQQITVAGHITFEQCTVPWRSRPLAKRLIV